MPIKYYVAVAFFIEKNEKILLGKRSLKKKVGPGIWEIPSGRIEKGEQPEEAVIREAKEELGISLKPLLLFDSYYFQRNNKQFVLLNYACETIKEPPKLLHPEHDELIWASRNQALELVSFQEQKKAINKYFELKKRGCF